MYDQIYILVYKVVEKGPLINLPMQGLDPSLVGPSQIRKPAGDPEYEYSIPPKVCTKRLPIIYPQT